MTKFQSYHIWNYEIQRWYHRFTFEINNEQWKTNIVYISKKNGGQLEKTGTKKTKRRNSIIPE